MVKREQSRIKTKVKAVMYYLSGQTLERTAARFKIHRNTIWRWTKKYRGEGAEALSNDTPLSRHWRRLPEKVEDAVIALKESQPGMTVRRAQKLLGEHEIKISLKGIWSIWQRYGLTGFAREELSHSYDEYLGGIVSPAVLNKIRALIGQNELQGAAEIINALPLFPYNDIILQIPARLLSLRRQVNRIRAEFGTISLMQYRKKAQRLRAKLEERNMNYSSLWVVIAECYALMWSGQPREVLQVVLKAKKMIKGIRDARLRFFVLLLEGQANAGLMRIEKAKKCVNQCKTIARTSRDPYFLMGGIGGIYSTMGYYREALHWTDKALKGAAPSYQPQLYVNIAQFYGTTSDYQRAFRALKKGQLDEWGFRSRASLIRAYGYLDQGDFQKAQAFAIETLMEVKKEGVRSLIHPATLILASCHRAAGEVQQAHTLVKEILPLLKKYDLRLAYWQHRMILGDTRMPGQAAQVPALRVAWLLNRAQQSPSIRHYRKAYAYAQKKKSWGFSCG